MPDDYLLGLAKKIGAFVTVFGPIGYILYFDLELSVEQLTKLLVILAYLFGVMFLYVELIRRS